MRYSSTLVLGAMLAAGVVFARPQPAVDEQPDVGAEVEVSRTAAQQFGGALKEALQQAIKTGGPANGVAICHDQAGKIAADLGAKLDMIVGRTSLKIRNPGNAPDNWELAVLKQFEARKAQGEPAGKLEFFAVIEDDQGQKTFRYMKAIPTASLCLACHGDKLDPEVDAKLKTLYPNDTARGFKEGDLRGAFTIAKPLP
ncbi:MAG: DUF3365 domain-containing protein [Candidatus Competibacter sp.]|nr:DUF3365 domain-containing protein [Candidatus Competibacter sp.]MDG4585563.1 DUF3365 domain-containing protein [Candidatus Competibacter sp.]